MRLQRRCVFLHSVLPAVLLAVLLAVLPAVLPAVLLAMLPAVLLAGQNRLISVKSFTNNQNTIFNHKIPLTPITIQTPNWLGVHHKVYSVKSFPKSQSLLFSRIFLIY